MPGFIKNIGGSNRMRFVKPGHDPNNLNLDPNLVIFDSETIGNLSVLDYGEDVVEWGTTTGSPWPHRPPPTYYQIRSWSLGYSPMVIAQIRNISGDTRWVSVAQFGETASLVSRPDGLFFRSMQATYVSYQSVIRWTAFRFPI